MAVARRADSHSGIAIKKDIAIDVFNPNALGALGNKFERWSRIRWRNKLCVGRNDLGALWTR
jgi:hypothetical protein